MSELYTHIALAIAVFISTNVDDIFLLAAFFSDRKIRPRSIVIGQFLGIGALVLVSCLAAWFAVALPSGLIALLGVVPLGLGIKQLIALRRPSDDAANDAQSDRAEHELEQAWHSQILAIAGVTIANGGDNLGVYIPLFASGSSWIPLFVAVFAAMTLLWCFMGHLIVNNRLLGDHIRRYGHKILPFVLIAIGIHILSGALVLL
ncbi:cadmium resistance transporter [Kaistia dalseonensis]|uniref:Cadmium resistance protein CadD (Predicted permease) n=1 Tax=Kaistia dalseonensis TaxID=410840 RepID=A0ABU0H3U8_9HYPH|nr:cadmium resistance transporter [Kaistia dalseonensis]MCX5494404.1 cadmium resistance transporter [Kaistia dalseonensis]MDQ0436983.1 cadmium resistance protein CadD (predicted permease) [Kaistia dalseonensis]